MLSLYYYKSYKAGQFPPSPENSKDAGKGALTMTFEYDNTNDVYIVPAWKIEPFSKNDALVKDFVFNAKLEYLDVLNFYKDDVALQDITVKDVYFL